MSSTSTLALAAAHRPDPRDARIEQLEADMQKLMADNAQLHADGEALNAKAQALESEVQDLRAGQATQIQTLKAQGDQITAVDAKVPAAPAVVTNMLNGRPVWTSANGRFSVTAHTVMQLDTGAYFQASPGPTSTDFRRSGPALGASTSNVEAAHARDLKAGTDFRRARLGLDGTVYGDWDWRILFDFGGSGVENTGQLYETWVQYSGFKPVRLRVGAFSPSIGMEDQASTNGMPFMERTPIEDMARGFAGGDTRVSAQAYAFQDRWLVSGALTGRTIGVLNTGTATAVPQTFGDQMGFVGRAAVVPLKGEDWLVQVGAHGSIAKPGSTGTNASGVTPITAQAIAFSNTQALRIDGTRLINTGNIDASSAYTVGAEFGAQKGPFLVQAEYERFGVHRTDVVSNPTFSGWYVEGLWTLTGEPRVRNPQTAAFDAPIPAHPFSWRDGAWGAWELGLRYSDANLNYHQGAAGVAQLGDAIRGGDEENLSVGLNWYPNPVVKFMFDYEHVWIDRLSPGTSTGTNNTVWLLPTGSKYLGAQIGQSYNAVAVRSQFAF